MSFAQHLAIGSYYPIDSMLHRLDARIKIIITLLFSLAVFLVNNFTALALFAFVIISLFFVAKLPLSLATRGLRSVALILLLTFFIQALFGDEPKTYFGPVGISEPGLFLGLLIVSRVLLLIIGASLLTLTTTPIELTDAIESLMSPLKIIKVPTSEIALMIAIALRFIPILVSEIDKIVKAQVARGARFDSKSLVKRVRSYIPILIPLFISIFRRADELAEAMDARGYHSGSERTKMKELKIKKADIIVLFFSVCLIGILAWVGNLDII